MWGSIALLAWVYAAYPFVAMIYGRLRPVRLTPRLKSPALVTVGIAVHNGADELAERVADIRNQTTPFEVEILVASDGSTDDIAGAVGRVAAEDQQVRLLNLPRIGQSAAQASIFAAAKGEIVVLTDIETRFEPGCLEALVAAFDDPRVGCATGVLRWHYDKRTDTARHEGIYWRYEQQVRAWESRAGWLAAATGALLAARRTLYKSVPAHASLDQMLPLLARAEDQLVLVAPAAGGSDRGTAGLREQFRSRTRIATQGIEANLRMSLRIAPWRKPGSFLAIVSHKLLRWATPLFVGAAVIAGVVAFLNHAEVAYLLPLGLTVIVGLTALAGYLGMRLGRNLPLTGFPMTIVAVNLAFALAWVNVIARRRVGTWESASSAT